VEDLVARIRQLIVDHPLTEDSSCQVRFNNFGESSLDILVVFHLQVDDSAAELKEREVLLLQIMDLVKDVGVEFAFPTRTLQITDSAQGISPRSRMDGTVIGFTPRT
jgi:MscS family membrane protein